MNQDTPPPSSAEPAPGQTPGIETEIDHMEAAQEKPWARMGALLLDIEKNGYWQDHGGSSFADYVTTFAERLGLHPSVLWRNRKAVQYYEGALRTMLTAEGIELPPVVQQPPKIGPEGVVLLERIGRVAPQHAFLDLARQAVQGTITRGKLRNAWYALSPVLDGKTARGRGNETPKANIEDASVAASVLEQLVLSALATRGPSWMGPQERGIEIQAYEAFLGDDSLAIPLGNRQSYAADAIAAAYVWPFDRVFLHGIEIKGRLKNDASLRFVDAAPYFDFFWLAMPREPEPAELALLPETIGLLVLEGNKLTTLRQAICNPDSEKRQQGTGRIAKALLARTLKRC